MKRNAFTFIEVIISITIFTIIAVTVYSVFSMGMKTWKRGEEGRDIENIRLCFLKMEKELKDSFFSLNMPFIGESQRIVFTIMRAGKIYVIMYFIDENGQLMREEKEIGKDDGVIKKLLDAVGVIKFEYVYDSGSGKGFEWKDSWDKEGIPFGVRVSLDVADTGQVYNKVVFIQQGDMG